MKKQERKKLLEEKENWQLFSNLLTEAQEELKRTEKLSDISDVISNLVYLSKRIFSSEDDKISSILSKLDKLADKFMSEAKQLDEKAKPLIEEIVILYNDIYDEDVTFDGDVDKWLNRTFPLISLYVNKNSKK